MELLPIGPVLFIDTPGMDDDQEGLGAFRVKKAEQVLHKTDVAVLVVEAGKELVPMELQLIDSLKRESCRILWYTIKWICWQRRENRRQTMKST